MPTDKQRNMRADETGKLEPGGMRSDRPSRFDDRGGEFGEKKATNADHDQKVAENRRRILEGEDDRKRVAPKQGDPSPAAPNDVSGEKRSRVGGDPDNERKSGDIVSGAEHEHFPGTQAGYDDRKEAQRPPHEANDDLGHLDRGENDDLSDLDRGGMPPMK